MSPDGGERSARASVWREFDEKARSSGSLSKRREDAPDSTAGGFS
jgi:hypothetical protein